MNDLYSLIIPSFFAGLLTFLAPCTLPLVPGYLGFISGVSLGDLKDPLKSGVARRKIFINGIFFILGFSAIFVLMGTLIGFIGAAFLYPYRLWLSRIGGIFVIIFGLFMLNVLKIHFLQGEFQLKTSVIFERGKLSNSFILGSAFAFGWTPCVGPILGSILLLASTSTTAFQGAVLLSIFSLGLAVPFLIIAAGIGSAYRHINNLSKWLSVISIVGGIFLIILGVLLATGNIGLTVSYGFKLLDFINYDGILNYM
jgi:cytochrome c-type biogenesis protein